MVIRLTLFFCLLFPVLYLALPDSLPAQSGGGGTYAPFTTPPPQQQVQAKPATQLPPPTQDDPRAPLTPRQRDLIIARILSRQGYYSDALKMYGRLVKQYPGDLEVYGYYVETLVNHQDYDMAMHELGKVLKTHPDSALLQSLQARIYMENGNFRDTYAFYQDILEKQPDDLGTMADYAYAARSAGDWQRAMELYRRILQADPENDNAYQAVQEITRERTALLAVATRLYNQGGTSQTNTVTARAEAQISNRTRLELSKLWVDIRRLEQEFTPSIHKQVDMTTAFLRFEATPRLNLYAGLAPYTGFRDSFAPMAGLRYDIGRLGVASLDVARDMPWYDPVDAVLYDGNYDKLMAGYNRTFNENWSMNLAAELWEYRLGDQHYGEKKTFSAQITRRLPLAPGLSASYGYYRSMFNYMDDQLTPVGMLENEAVHSLSMYFERRFCRYLTLVLTGGLSQDEFKSRTNYFFAPSLRIRMGNHMEWNTGFEYQSDENTADGGESTAITTDVRILF